MRISVSSRSDAEVKDLAKIITTWIYHCDTCLAFVRSEDIPEEIASEDKISDKKVHWFLCNNL